MKPDTITVRVTKQTELEAGSADVHVVVEGSAIFSTGEAFAKAAELRTLLDSLTNAGVERESIKLQSVRLKSGNWSAIRSSGARYAIVVKAVGLDPLPKVLGAIAAHKGAEMTHLEWHYPGEQEARRGLREEAIAGALVQARLDAQALGVEVLGVYQLDVQDPQQTPWRATAFGDDDLSMDSAMALGAPEIGFQLGSSKTVRIDLRVEFRVGAMSE